MAQIITNQASLNYQYNGQTATTLSNVASAVLNDPVTVSKVAVEESFRAGDALTYAVSLQNTSGGTLTNVTVTDDLGTYPFGTFSVTPLTYQGPALLFLNGIYSGNVTPTVTENEVTFTLPTLAAGAQAQLIYRVTVNEYALLTAGSVIRNTATVSADGITATAESSATLPVESYADVTVTKSMAVTTVATGSSITYQFLIENYGNAEATDIVLTDAFDPAPTSITVQLNGTTLAPDAYTYAGGVLTLSTGITLPAATLTQDVATGEVRITPSSLNVTVVGTL